MEAKTARIVPGSTGSIDCMGTEVFVGDQKMLVRRIELVADVETGVWSARIDCEVVVDGEIVAELIGEDGGTDGS